MAVFVIIAGFIFLTWWGFHKCFKDIEEQERQTRIEEANSRRAREDRERQQKEQERQQREQAQRVHEYRMATDSSYRRRYNEEQDRIRRQREETERKIAEEKRLAEQKRRNELKAKFHYITLGCNNAAYRYDYYPKNRYPYVESEQESNRRSIWNFKNGSYSIGVRIVSDFLEGNYTEEQMKKLVFCVIPASTQYKNDLRYQAMCLEIATKYPIVNGFNYISICSDRENSRGQKSANTIGNLTFSGSVYGKDVILFDDVTTRGTSFIQAAQALKEKGARSVYGLFIGRTVSIY